MVLSRRSPTRQTLLAMVAVFALQVFGGAVGVGAGAFALSLPLDVDPWTLVVATYAHGGLGHLLANALALVLVGSLVERGTTPLRFHAFFVVCGALAGVAELAVGALLGHAVAVVGASGAVFGLMGYAVVGNRVVGAVGRRVEVGRGLTLVLFLVLAAVVTAATAAPGLALAAHFTGFLVGLLAGRARLLRA